MIGILMNGLRSGVFATAERVRGYSVVMLVAVSDEATVQRSLRNTRLAS
jgi:hypothetical protein